MQSDKELLQTKKEELFQFEKIIDGIDQDMSNIKRSCPDDYEKFKEFASKKKKQTKGLIKTLKEEIYDLEVKLKIRKESDEAI